jgi:hypothetical protein
MIKFWKWAMEFSAVQYLMLRAKRKTTNSYKMRVIVADHGQWLEMVSAIGELENRVLVDCANASNEKEETFFKARLENLNTTKKRLEDAWSGI